MESKKKNLAVVVVFEVCVVVTYDIGGRPLGNVGSGLWVELFICFMVAGGYLRLLFGFA